MHSPRVRFADIASASRSVAGVRGRLEKVRLLVLALENVPADEMAAAVGWLALQPLSGPLGVGAAGLWALSKTPPAPEATVSLGDVEAALEDARRAAREELLPRVAALFAKLTQPERDFFVGALTASLRQGSLGGVMLVALARLARQDEEVVRRAVMVTGSIPLAAAALLGPGRAGPAPSALELFRPVAPMLASPAASLQDVFADGKERLVEWKVDGIRAQIHKRGDRVAVFSRQGNEITAGCAPVLGDLAAMAVESAVVDSEIVVVDARGVSRPFQDTFSAIASKGTLRGDDSLRAVLFDCLHCDGRDLVDEPLSARREALARFAPEAVRMPGALARSAQQAEVVQREALAAGHEGVVVKDLASTYRLGARGRAWQKLKEFATVDLVVLAAEWGSGRRKGLLSNLHLGARRDDGTFSMVGKTFKGLTDEVLLWQTQRLQALATEARGHVVHVRPELVVEIRYSDVQRSPRYPGGVALRFARVVRYREDKSADESDALSSLVARLPEESPPGRRPGARRTAQKAAPPAQLSLFGIESPSEKARGRR